MNGMRALVPQETPADCGLCTRFACAPCALYGVPLGVCSTFAYPYSAGMQVSLQAHAAVNHVYRDRLCV